MKTWAEATGQQPIVDKRTCLLMFRKLAKPNVKWITLIFFIIIDPLASFISDHALAAMFFPIGILLYQNSLTSEVPEDTELAKMLMIGIAMACNIGGPGAPSGGARNVIMMTYLNDMFGMDIVYFQWITYGLIEKLPACDAIAPLGPDSGLPLMAVSSGLTGIITNLMADGPAAAAVGPITLNMAGLVYPGTTFLPFMAMSTAIASSFAFCLIIGTPPNAIVYASGYLEPKDYLRIGVPIWIITNILLLVMTAGYWGLRGFGNLQAFWNMRLRFDGVVKFYNM